ncbi:MAG TPA: hypothetical protein VGR67_10570 [Candidatus Polarisedimenticolia bacterium]|nr:hypothetical protein [Candidatus Polarisedimenticolia bacterium]
MIGARGGRQVGIRHAGQPEIEDLHRAVGRDLDVRRLEIAMDDSPLVGRLESLGDLPCDRQGLLERHGPVRDSVGERRSLDQLEHQRRRPGRFFHPIDGADGAVAQRGQDLSFTAETGEPVGIPGKGLREHLDGHLPVEPGILGAIHLAHAARAERSEDFIRAQTCSRRESHADGIINGFRVQERRGSWAAAGELYRSAGVSRIEAWMVRR